MWWTWCNRPTCENHAPTGSTNFLRASMPFRLEGDMSSDRQYGRLTPLPSVLPLQQSSGMKLVGTKLEDTSFSPRRSCREESELLAKLLRPTSQVRNQLAVGLEML